MCTICKFGTFPQSVEEIIEFEQCRAEVPVPPAEWFEDQFQQIMLGLEIRKILKPNSGDA